MASLPTVKIQGRVLIVDDDDDVREITQDMLERRGYEVVAVESGADALAYLAHDTPAVMLLDLEMDDVNGWEVIGALEKRPDFAKITIVVVSGSESTPPRGVQFLRKPFRIEALTDILVEREKSR
ncbi:MAG: response regulator receiver protein [Myxococcales bacterium]|nr:response regulator receiver protein [Myxococcales bacterium]